MSTTTTTTQTAELKVEASTPLSTTPKQVQETTKTETDDNTNLAALATGGYEFPGIPKIDDPYKKRQWQLEHMAGAFRVFARKGYCEGTSGHISVRDPVDPNTFWINP
jgi:hypothetical protein